MGAMAETNEHDNHGHHDHAGHGYGDNSKVYVHIFRDDQGSKAGMWLFLFTEILLFGGLFFLYYAYRVAHRVDFHNAATELNVVLGAVNTIILLTSSLTMVLAIVALQRNSIKLSLFYMFTTIACAFGFLVNKYFEWSFKIHNGNVLQHNKYRVSEYQQIMLQLLVQLIHQLKIRIKKLMQKTLEQ